MYILAILSFMGAWILMGNSEREPSWRISLVQGAIVWSAYMVISTEVLSWFHAINKLALSIVWALPVLGGLVWIWRRLKNRRILRLPVVYHRDTWFGVVLDALLILVLVITAVVAFTSPPNSSESMISGMSRVAHWAQNQSLNHYETLNEAQNYAPPGAELIQLNFYVLSGSDRMVNMVAWMAYFGSIAAAASLADVMGATIRGRRFAAIFGATLPVAITQATSSTGYILVTFWTLSAILMLLFYTRKSQKPIFLVLSALAAALAVLTHPIALIFLLPFVLYGVVALWQRLGLGRMLLWALAALAIMGAINSGYLLRNQLDYGRIYPQDAFSEQTNEVHNWKVLISNISRNFALQAKLPGSSVDIWTRGFLNGLHEDLRQAINDPRTSVDGIFYIPERSTSEQTSSNPLHTFIFLVSMVAVVILVILKKEKPDILIYAGAILFSILLYCALLKWSPNGGRLQLPFFFMFGPVAAIVLDKLEKYQVEGILALILLVCAIPWLFQTQERPLLVNPERTSEVSVLAEDRTQLYFATNPEDAAPYLAMTDAIKALGITNVGLHLRPQSEEYPLWALLGAPDADLRIEWVTVGTGAQKDLDSGFEPDAIICEDCSAQMIETFSQDYLRKPFGSFDLFIRAAD